MLSCHHERFHVGGRNEHHNLILRPDDVWLAITTQFELFIKHAQACDDVASDVPVQLEMDKIAPGYPLTVDVTIDDNGVESKSLIFACH
ncbi:hypothetical protein DYB28_004744 [Aphanomyces astaci]|uniref:Uncharacterized protein n=1 Tax=Aphanomyces astaci TaxID=112090 RepID=A0A9X8H2F4_APHAT|nr:hypothetical protein DYB28_004744 [Aphanomyces astaci]